MKNAVECASAFPRWLRGSCIEASPVYAKGEEEEPVIFSFYRDVSADPNVIRMMLAINQAAQADFAAVNAFLERWRRYGGLWKHDKRARLEKFVKAGPGYVLVSFPLSLPPSLSLSVMSATACTGVCVLDTHTHTLQVRGV